MENKRKNTEAPTIGVLLCADLISLPLTLLPGLLGWGSTIFWLTQPAPPFRFEILLLLSPFILCTVFILTLFILRLLLPSLKPGVYRSGLNKMFIAWFAHVALSRAPKISAMQTLLQSFNLTRYLFWRALGAKVSFRCVASLNVNMVDYPMITIEEGATIGDRVQVSGHSFVGNRLFIGPVRFGKNCFVGVECMVGAKTDIGDNVWVGINNTLFRDKLPAHSRLENFEWGHGSRGRCPSFS
ncbi:MAG: hypothetical protein IPJ84_14725 [Bdellovibrionales bacterium]|nr:hypothetical protein [Bdellovibrionales bacterium]